MTFVEKLKTFGWDLRPEEYLADLERSNEPPRFDYLIPNCKAGVTDSANNVAICYYLLGRKTEAARFAREEVAAVLDLFYGDWQRWVLTDIKTLDPEWWRAHWIWMDPFSEGLAWASALGDWKSVKKIADYPGEVSNLNTSYKPEDKAAYLALAYFLRGAPASSYQHHFKQIAKGKKEKPKLLAAVLMALQDKSERTFQTSLETYLRYFTKREFKKRDLDKLLCFDGTTLLNVGKRQGFDFKVPPEVQHHIISRLYL